MKQSELLIIIQNNLKDYPIDYLRGKSSNKYPDSITKRLAIYNAMIYDEIYSLNPNSDFESEINEKTMENIIKDIDYYFSVYDVYNEEEIEFTKNLCLYLSLIAKKPLHPKVLTLKKMKHLNIIMFIIVRIKLNILKIKILYVNTVYVIMHLLIFINYYIKIVFIYNF